MIRCPTLPFVPSAVALGHLAGYAVAHPDPTDRAHALVGHGHLGVILAVGAASGLFGLAALARARADDARAAPRWGRLAQLGALGYWALEVLERAAQTGLGPAVAEPGVWWGIGLQAVIAGVLVGLARAAGTIGRCLARRPASRASTPAVASRWHADDDDVVVRSAGRLTPNRRRGPPLLTA